MRTIRKSVMLAALMAAVTFTSCSNDDEITDNNQPVRFTAGVGEVATPRNVPGTRAADNSWAKNDVIGIFMVDHTDNTIVGDAANKKYTTTLGNGAFTADGNDNIIYYPKDDSPVDFIAYYPYNETYSANETTYDVNVTTQTDPTKIDLLYAKATNGDDGYTKGDEVSLNFEHKLAKIVMKTSADASVGVQSLAGMTVTIKGMKTTGTFNLLGGGSVTATDTSTDITPRTVSDGSQYDAIIMPGEYGSEVKVDFTLDSGETFTWNVGGGTSGPGVGPSAGKGTTPTFEPGKAYTYNITLTRTGVQVTGKITPWTTGTPTTPNVTAN